LESATGLAAAGPTALRLPLASTLAGGLDPAGEDGLEAAVAVAFPPEAFTAPGLAEPAAEPAGRADRAAFFLDDGVAFIGLRTL
jgi:hypothetical protein